jgi:hypothetical protein
MAEMSFTTAAAQNRIAKILQALESSDQTVASISTLIFISRRWSREYLEHLRQQRRVHITAWVKDIGQGRSYPRPVYRIGGGVDAIKPRPMTTKEKTAARVKRRRDDPEFYLKERAGNQLRRFKPKPDKAAAWLMQA